MFSHAHATQAVYHARLRMELRDRLGAAWDVPRSGMGDVVGVDPTLRRLFSQRSAAMDEYLAGRRRPPERTGADPRSLPCHPPGQGPYLHRGFVDGRVEAAGRRFRVRPGRPDPGGGPGAIRRAGWYRPRPRPLRPRGAVRTAPHARPSGCGRRPRRGIAAGDPLRGHRVGRHQRGGGRRCSAVPFGVRRRTGGPPIGDVRAALGHPRRGPGGGDRFGGAGGPGHRPGAARAGPRHGRVTLRPTWSAVRSTCSWAVDGDGTAQRSMPDRSSPICRPGVGSGRASPRSGPARLRSVRHRVGHGSRA